MNTRIDRKKLLIGAYNLADYARTEAHVRDIKACGIDMIICLQRPSKELLDLLQKYDIGCCAGGIVPGWWGGDGERAGKLGEINPTQKYIEAAAKFIDHPAVRMIDIGDEPSALDFDRYGEVVELMRGLFPNQIPYLNLYPNYASVAENTDSQTLNQLGTVNYTQHIREYVEKVGLPYISYDFYVYPMGSAGLGMMYDNFNIVADACRRTGRDFWFIPQCNGRNEGDFTSVNQMRFQAYCALAYGAVAINWACWTKGWWCNNILDDGGNKTVQYEKLQKVNAELHAFSEEYMKYRNVNTHLIGFSAVPVVKDHPALTVKESVDLGFVREVRTEDGGALVAGEMVDKDDPSKHALLILNATDYLDKAPAPKTVKFRSLTDNVRIAGGNLPEGLSIVPCRDGKSGFECSFVLDNCKAAMVEFN